MGIPLRQQIRVGAYVVGQRLKGKRRYPLVLMLEPLFRCNLACAGCGKIDYPSAILNRRLSVEECLAAVDECGAPIVSIPGGEPLIHKDIVPIVEGIIERKKFVYLCTNALLVAKRIDRFKPSPYLTFSIHLDGMRQHHDRSVCQEGVFDKAIEAIRLLRSRGFRVNVNTTLFDGVAPDEVGAFFDFVSNELDVEGITVSPGYAYERAPDQDHFLNRRKTKELFRAIFRLNKGRRWKLNHSSLYLDFLAGNQSYHCTPWGNPTRNIFGWQRPCYLLGEGFVGSFKELMEGTDWDRYGTGNYEKCADCMAHCGYEPSAVNDAMANPLKAFWAAIRKPVTEGAMAAEIPLDNQRPAEQVFDRLVTAAVAGPAGDETAGSKTATAAVYRSKALGSDKGEVGRESSHAA